MSFLESRLSYSLCQIVNFIIRFIVNGVNHECQFSNSSWSIYILDLNFVISFVNLFAVSVNFQYQWIHSISIFNYTWIHSFLLRRYQEQYDLRLLHRNILIER